MILFKASIINAQKHLTLYTLNVLFSAVHCLHSPSLVCFTGQWDSALTVNIGFCFSLPKSWECYNQPLAKFHLETQLGSCNFTATVNCQLVVWWLLHTNVGIHNHKNYQKPQQIFSPFFWHVAYRELHAYLISSIYSKQLSILLLPIAEQETSFMLQSFCFLKTPICPIESKKNLDK